MSFNMTALGSSRSIGSSFNIGAHGGAGNQVFGGLQQLGQMIGSGTTDKDALGSVLQNVANAARQDPASFKQALTQLQSDASGSGTQAQNAQAVLGVLNQFLQDADSQSGTY